MGSRRTTVIAALIGLAAVIVAMAFASYGAQASADPATSIEYAEYRNDRWHYSLAIPADMMVSEHEREGGGHTTQFMDAAGDKELIISAWPFSQLDVTLAREGTASTVTDQPDHLEIVNVLRDGVFRVWFTKNGTLYTVTTLSEDEAWLTDLLTTWQFTE